MRDVLGAGRLQAATLLGSIALFALCLNFDAYLGHEGTSDPGIPGIYVLTFGLYGLFAAGKISWLANPLLFGAWVAMATKHAQLALGLAIASFLLAALFLFDPTIPGDTGSNASVTVRVGGGYWLWVASTLLAVFGAVLRVATVSRSPDET